MSKPVSKHKQWTTRTDTDKIFQIRLNVVWIF